MSDIILSVENLSKRYLVAHRSAQRYTALRDVIGREARNFFRKALDFARGRQIVQGDEVEEFWALKGVNFSVKRGEVVGIIGRNGAGKSTLLKILSRITEPTEGKIELRGRVASLLEVGTGFHPELTGRENIFLNGAILGMTRQEIRNKFDEIVAFAEVQRFLDTPVKHYSSGMYVRLAFAVAAHLEPEILIVDEVLAVGDIQFQQKCLGKMEGVVKEGRTVLFVSHQISAVNQLCQNVIWLDKGRIVDCGPKSRVLGSYLLRGISGEAIVTLNKSKSDGDMFFTKVSVLDQERRPSTELDAQACFYICLHYEIAHLLREVEMAIRIKTMDGSPVFTTVYSDYSDMEKMNKTPGSYVATVKIPALFLMPGSYTISAHAWQFRGHYRPLDISDDIVRFNICETGTKMAKYNDHKNIGVVLVDFIWDERPATVEVV